MRHAILPFVSLSLLVACADSPAPTPAPAPAPAPVVSDVRPGMVPGSDGVPIAYTLRGQGDPTLVFLPGWMGDQSVWDQQVDVFDDAHRVVTVDLPGHGASGANRTDWSLHRLGQDVAAVLEALDLRGVVLVGHSMSGPVALEAAPLSGGRVRVVIGVDTLHDATMTFDPAQWAELLKRYEADFPGTCTEFVTSMFRPDADTALVDRLRASMCAGRKEIAIALLRGFSGFDGVAVMGKAGVPVRAINADALPTNVEGNRKLADFSVKIIKGVGHFPMQERPAEFNRLLSETLAELPAR